MLKGILFDLDGTLRHNVPEGYETFVAGMAECGAPLNTEQRAQGERWGQYYWAIAPEMITDLAELGADTPAFWIRYTARQIEAFGWNGGSAPTHLAEQISAYMRTQYQPVDHVPDDVRPTLRSLRERGHKVGLVSNRREVLGPVAETLGLADLFDLTLSAGEAQAWKPAPEIFHLACRRLGLTPAETVYVGDNYYADIEGARGAGLEQVLIDPRSLYPEPGCARILAIGELLALV
jgi:HAD superfamily hydrolase (TIGR01509 family)